MGEKSELQYTRHFKAMLKERSIPMSLVTRTLTKPEKLEERADGTKIFCGEFQNVKTDG
jgi:hypothetical protein